MRKYHTQNPREHNHFRGQPLGESRKVVPMSVVRPVPLTRLTPGTVVWAHVPYADGTGEKSRPAVVVTTRGRDIELLPATTSSLRHGQPGFVSLTDLHAAGLERRSSVRLESVTVDRIEIINITGQVAPLDAARIGITLPNAAWEGNDAA